MSIALARSRLIVAVIVAAMLAALALAVASTTAGHAHPVAQSSMAVLD